jgi:exopolysaccharide biosynthesis protein
MNAAAVLKRINRDLAARRRRAAAIDGSYFNGPGFRLGFILGVGAGSAGAALIVIIACWLLLP